MASNRAGTVNELKMKKLKQWMLIAVVIAAIVVSFSMVFIKFLFDLWVYNNNVQAAQRTTQETLEFNLEAYEGLFEDFQVLEEAQGTPRSPDADIVFDSLPTNYDYPALASSIQKLASSSGVTLRDFRGVDEEGAVPGPSFSPEPHTIEFGVELSGSYEDIQVFINALDLSIRPFHIELIELRGSEDALRADINIRTYFQPTQNLDYPERTIQ